MVLFIDSWFSKKQSLLENSESINLSQSNMLQISHQKDKTNLILGTKIFICSGN